MSCRTLVVALGLLVSSPALAQSADSDGGASDGQGVTVPAVDSAPDAGLDAGWPDRRRPRPALAGLRDACGIDADGDGVIEGVGECPPVVPRDGGAVDAGPRWTVDFDTVVGANSPWGQWHTVVASSALASIRYRTVDGWSIGAIVPFGVGQERVGTCSGLWCGDGPEPGVSSYAHLGAASLFANWEARPGPATQLHIGMLVALPTALVGNSRWVEGVVARGVEPVRGFEDHELFARGVAIVPSVAVLHDVGRVEASASVKAPLRHGLDDNDRFALDVVGAAQVMVKALSRPRVVVSGGARVVGVASSWRDSFEFFSVALEPRVDARLSTLALRVGLIIPLAYGGSGDSLVTNFTGCGKSGDVCPTAWGVRAGVGYSF